jgi:hypothetical protein
MTETLVGVVTVKDNERNYVPSRPQPSYRTVLMMGKAEADPSEYEPVRHEQAEENDGSERERKPIQSLFTILKMNLTKMKMTKWRSLKKKGKYDGQGAQSFTIQFRAGCDHRDSPKSRLKARETAFESPSSSALGIP